MLVVLWVGSIVITFSFGDVEKEYDERGIEVTATITEVIPRPRFHTDYRCTYYNNQGQKVKASLILNQFGGEVGQVVVGKYLPESPGEVYCEASNALKYGVVVFFYLLTILYTIAFFGGGLKDDDDAEIAMIYEKYNMPPPRTIDDTYEEMQEKVNEDYGNGWDEITTKRDDNSGKQSSTGLRLKM